MVTFTQAWPTFEELKRHIENWNPDSVILAKCSVGDTEYELSLTLEHYFLVKGAGGAFASYSFTEEGYEMAKADFAFRLSEHNIQVVDEETDADELHSNQYFSLSEHQAIRKVASGLKFKVNRENVLFDTASRPLCDGCYIFDRFDSVTVGEYVANCKCLSAVLAESSVPVVILKLSGLKIAVCHPELTLQCNDKGLLDCEGTIVLKASEYEKRFPQNCFVHNSEKDELNHFDF